MQPLREVRGAQAVRHDDSWLCLPRSPDRGSGKNGTKQRGPLGARSQGADPVAESAQYVGGDRWVLYDLADCELHALVDADAQGNVQRLYGIQFEAYLPTRPELKHTYDSPRHARLGMDFFVDTWVRAKDDETGFRSRTHS